MAKNPYVNKVVYNGRTLIDTSTVTVTTDTLAKGVTALDATGKLITGTFDREQIPWSDGNGNVMRDNNGNVLTFFMGKLIF